MKGSYLIIISALFTQLLSCTSSSEFKRSLTFYASFDQETTAEFALGDPNIYSAKASYVNSSRVLEGIEKGMNNTNHQLIEGKGKFGDALEFDKMSNNVIFYKSKDNIAHTPENWTGTISFWLSVDPATDLDGYTDPIQITDKSFNDASIWVDFTDKSPKDFRLGVFGDKNAWTKDTLHSPARNVFAERLVTVKASPFSRSRWTHVLISYDGLGTANGQASLYMDGEKMSTISGLDDPFTWNLEQSNIYLGLNFTGLMDELAIFNKPFTDQQVLEFYQLKGGVKSIL